MKVRALDNFRMKEEKTGKMLSRKPKEEFEMDPGDPVEAVAIFDLLSDLKIEIIDEKFIPKKAAYRVLNFATYEVDGMSRQLRVGDSPILDQSIACGLLIQGYIVPVSKDGWTPRKLLAQKVSEKPAKEMFDPLEKKESWMDRKEKW